MHSDIDIDAFSALVGDIHDASIAPERWTGVLNSVREFVDGACATIFAKDVTGRLGGVFHSDGRMNPESVDSYFAKYAPLDPTNAIQVFAEVDQAIVTSDRLDLEDFAATRFAREWALPQGLVDMVLAPIERRGSWAAMFGVFRHEAQGRGDATTSERVRLLAPHVRQAVAVGQMLGAANAMAAQLGDVIDGLAAGVVLVDGEGRLVHANTAARHLLESRGLLATGGRDGYRLRGTRLPDLLPAVRHAQPNSHSIELPDGARYVAHVLPLTDARRALAGAHRGATAALFLQPERPELRYAPEAMAKAFELTPTELRVVVATMQHGGVAEVAEALGVGVATVRTHLHRIFAKTGSKRQADLVKLVAAYASPLRKS